MSVRQFPKKIIFISIEQVLKQTFDHGVIALGLASIFFSSQFRSVDCASQYIWRNKLDIDVHKIRKIKTKKKKIG